MNYSLYFFDEVKSDIREAKDWYKTQKPGLEKRFAQEIKKSIVKLKNHPKSYEVRYKIFALFLQRCFHTLFIYILMIT